MRSVRKMLPVYLISLTVLVICALLASRSVTVLSAFLETPDAPRLPVIVLDPGHGGEDGGAVSSEGIRECELNLEISLRARDLLRFLGLPVVMTRESDVSIHSPEAETVSEKKISDLKNRVRITENAGFAILVSIHQNMFSEPRYKGAQIFYASTIGSEALAECLQELFDTRLDPSNHRKAKESKTVYLLNRIHCPGILIECGFLSNPEEARSLQTAAYQKKLAASICAGLVQALSDPGAL